MRNLLAAAMLVLGCAPLLEQASAYTSTPAAAPAERLARTMLRNTAGGHMQKCDLCLDRLEAGEKAACTTTCPAGALAFGTMDELPGLAGKKTVRQLEESTKPSIFVPVAGA
jgi:Fe-S-cluster-containing dehydrogenase component